MDKKPLGFRSLKSESTLGPPSAFAISLNLEFQVGPLPGQVAIPKAGEICPKCDAAKIDYDGLLNLSCPECGYTLAGCFT